MSSLPKLNTPIHYMTIPSSKKKVKFRPFFVKEEKIMMMVKESTDVNEMADAMKSIIEACTFNKVDVNSLAIFDIEYMFLQLRSKSVGEIVELNMKCNNMVEIPKSHDHPAGVDNATKPCGGIIPFVINIADIKVNFPENHSNTIILEDDIGITFKYPSIDTMATIDSDDEIELIVDLIDNIFDKDNVYDAKDTNREELKEFVENITNKQFVDIREKFFETMPSLEYTAKYKYVKCGYEDEYTFRGISDFF
jgi:hypothetical protein